MILGLDTRRWDDNPTTPQTIDWAKAKSAGVKFIIMKATEGAGYVDPVFALHKKNSAGILARGSYHYWRPAISAKIQAEHYFNTAGKLELPPVLDVEDYYSELPKGAKLESALIEMLTEIDKAFGQECMIYTSLNIIKYYLALKPTSPLCKRKLWIAAYGVATPVITPFAKWTIWQYTDRGDSKKYGITEGSAVDENWYNGTIEDFNREFGIDAPPTLNGVKVKQVSVKGVSIPDLVTVKLEVDGIEFVRDVDQRPVVVDPPASDFPHLYRIKDDLEAGWSPNGPRPYLRVGLPSTVPIFGGDAFFRVPDKWVEYLRKLMSPQTFNYVFKPASGWQNGQELYVVRELTFSGNVVEVIGIEGNKAYIKALTTDDTPPAALIRPTKAQPHTMVQMFTTQYDDHLDTTTDGRNPYALLMVKPSDKPWIDVANLVRL